jgi:hypothetical protein
MKIEGGFPPFRALVGEASVVTRSGIDGIIDDSGAPRPIPGEDCPTCNRRVPKLKTEKTPPTKHKGYWVPADEYPTHEELLAAAAQFLGCYDQAFYEFKTVTLALALILQDENLRGFAQRGGA